MFGFSASGFLLGLFPGFPFFPVFPGFFHTTPPPLTLFAPRKDAAPFLTRTVTILLGLTRDSVVSR